MFDVTLTPHGVTRHRTTAMNRDIDQIIQQNQIMKGHRQTCWIEIGNALHGRGAFGIPKLTVEEYNKVLDFCGPIQDNVFYSYGAQWSVRNHELTPQSYQAMKDIKQMFPKYC
jgi:hypothetical protein